MIKFILAMLGLILSAYALYVKNNAEKNKKYKPICDISKHVSCTKAFLSKEGALTGFPNPLLGIFFYILVIVLYFFHAPQLIFLCGLLASIVSVYLAYTSYVKQRNFCLVCTGVYLINILLMILPA